MAGLRIKTRRGKLDAQKVRAVWSQFSKYTRPHRPALFVAFIGAVGVIGAQIIAPWPIKIIFDYILSDNMSSSWLGGVMDRISSGPASALGWVCGAVLLIAVADAAFSYIRDITLAQTGQQVVGKIRKDLFCHLQTLPPADLAKHHTGALLTRLTTDIQMLRQMLVNAIINAGESLMLIVALVAVMFWLNPTLAAVGVAVIPITLWASYRISRQIRTATNKQREKESAIASLAHDVFGALSIVQAFNREKIEKDRFSRQNRSSIRAGVKATRLESKLYRIVSLASAVGMCAILYLGVRSVLAETMTAGDLLVFISYLRAVNKPMRRTAKLAGQVAKASACGQRVAEIFAITPSVRDRNGATEVEHFDGQIVFENVTFSYPTGSPALEDVSLTIQAGQRVAIVGHTGAGKTTMVKLILRFYDPQQGCVRIDGTDIRDITLQSLRRRVGWVHQDTLLFGMTVAENIALGRPEAEIDEIREVARVVQADEFIDALPDGYETVLGQGGSTLSGGQRQRLALARALLRNPPILLLDEPASGLDPLTRQSVEQAWMSKDNKATTLVICHRLAEMERFDRILVVARGGIREAGPHEALVAAGGEYAALYAAGSDDGFDSTVRERTPC